MVLDTLPCLNKDKVLQNEINTDKANVNNS